MKILGLPAGLMRKVSENWQAFLVMLALLAAGWGARGVVNRIFGDYESIMPRLGKVEERVRDHEVVAEKIKELEAESDSIRADMTQAYRSLSAVTDTMRGQVNELYCYNFPGKCEPVPRGGEP